MITKTAQITQHPLLVATDGRSGVGKSTLAAKLVNALDACLISGDDFYCGGTGLRAETAQHLAHDCIDWRRQRQVLTTLKSGQAAQFHSFDWAAFDGSVCTQPVTLHPKPILVLEGVYAARPELRDLIDVSVLVTLPDKIRLDRLKKREGSVSDWEKQWHRAEEWYFKHLAPAEVFDVVLESA